jgi:hypothetical protein
MSVVVLQVSGTVVVVEARLGLSVESIIEIFLHGVQSNRTDGYEARREVHIFCLIFLRATQETLIKDLILEDKHGASAIS